MLKNVANLVSKCLARLRFAGQRRRLILMGLLYVNLRFACVARGLATCFAVSRVKSQGYVKKEAILFLKIARLMSASLEIEFNWGRGVTGRRLRNVQGTAVNRCSLHSIGVNFVCAGSSADFPLAENT